MLTFHFSGRNFPNCRLVATSTVVIFSCSRPYVVDSSAPNPGVLMLAAKDKSPKSARFIFILARAAQPPSSSKFPSRSSFTQISTDLGNISSGSFMDFFLGLRTPITITFTSLRLGLPSTRMVFFPS